MWPFRKREEPPTLAAAARLAGFFCAHAVWCVAEGETLVPILGGEGPDGRRALRRMAEDDLGAAVKSGRDRLESNADRDERAVLVYDGYVTLGDRKVDALLVEARVYGPSPGRIVMAVPYRHAKHEAGFAVHRPKFLSVEPGERRTGALAKAFFGGVERHEEGNAVWNAKLDESV